MERTFKASQKLGGSPRASAVTCHGSETVYLFCGLTQLCAAVVSEDPGKDGILGEVVAAAVSQVVEVEEILVVAQMAALPLQHVTLCCVLCHMVLCTPRRSRVMLVMCYMVLHILVSSGLCSCYHY